MGDVIEVGVGSPPVYEAMMVVGTDRRYRRCPRHHHRPAWLCRDHSPRAIPDGSSIYLVDQRADRRRGQRQRDQSGTRPSQEQYSQTVQHAYSISGALASSTNYVSGYGTPVQRDKWFAMTCHRRRFRGGPVLRPGRQARQRDFLGPAMKGLEVPDPDERPPTSRSNYAAYKPSDLVRDVTHVII